MPLSAFSECLSASDGPKLPLISSNLLRSPPIPPIASALNSSSGVSDIETEQCREQEQEKEQEQEQEQEIEMERYVDMAYQRDGEEPRRWAFCTLGQLPKTDAADAADAATVSTAAARASRAPCWALPLFGDGTFYPASEFRVHSRAPLPFPPSLAVSRNHFNLEWMGERRLKNAVMVLEWVPCVAQLRRTSPLARTLSSEQASATECH